MAIRAIATDSQDFNNPSTTGKPGRDERLDFKNEAGDTVFSIMSDADGTASIQGDAVPKVYRALLTQSSTNAPTATVLQNTLGGTVVWVYDSPGNYHAELQGAFPANRTWCNFQNVAWDSQAGNALYRNNSDQVNFIVAAGDGFLDSGPETTGQIEILVYP